MDITESCFSHSLSVAFGLFSVVMPDDIIGQSVNLIAGALGHLGKPFRLGLVLKRIGREIDTWVELDGGHDDGQDLTYPIDAHRPSQ